MVVTRSSDSAEAAAVEVPDTQGEDEASERFEDVEFGVPQQEGPAPLPVKPAKPAKGLFDKMRSTIAPGRAQHDGAGQAESLLGDTARPSHAHMEALSARHTRSSSAAVSSADRQQSYNVTQSQSFIDFNIGPHGKRPSGGPNSISLTAVAANNLPTQPAAGPPQEPATDMLPLSEVPGGGVMGTPLDPRPRLQQLAGKLQHIAIERVFILLLVAVVAVVLALFFAALYFVHQHRQSHTGCLTTIAAQLAVANGSKIVVQGLGTPAVTVCLGEDGEGPWVTEDTFQALMAAHSDLYLHSRVSLSFDLPDNSSRWTIQLELDRLTFDPRTAAAELEVDDWYAPPRTTYPGSAEFSAVYGSSAPLGSPVLVFKLDAEQGTVMVAGSGDDRR
ncbi:hypothetical protein N2152v2_011155 [Parachlorella kessleri]